MQYEMNTGIEYTKIGSVYAQEANSASGTRSFVTEAGLVLFSAYAIDHMKVQSLYVTKWEVYPRIH